MEVGVFAGTGICFLRATGAEIGFLRATGAEVGVSDYDDFVSVGALGPGGYKTFSTLSFDKFFGLGTMDIKEGMIRLGLMGFLCETNVQGLEFSSGVEQ